MADDYPQVVEVVCTDREKGIFIVSFIPSEGAKTHQWGILADDELHAFQRIKQEYVQRRKRKRKHGDGTPTMSFVYEWGPGPDGVEYYDVGEATGKGDMSFSFIKAVLCVWAERQRRREHGRVQSGGSNNE